jgi:LemA protein
MTLLWVVIIIVVIALLYVVAAYNGLVSLKTRTEEAWSDITVQLKRRYDLIPNLVSTVKGYAKHEKKVFEDVTKARTEAMNAKGLGSKAEAEKSLAGALKSVFAVAENYPNLKANENFLKLQGELSETENKIEASRRFYNANVRDYNIRIKSFPTNIVANSFSFASKDLFDVAEGEKSEVEKAPKVEV